jgi:multidrug resistance efflux pump
LLACPDLAQAADHLVVALASALDLRGATIALHERGRTRLLASSNRDLAHLQPDLHQKLLGALDEALEQAVCLTWPAAASDPAPALASIRVELNALQQEIGGAIAVLPMGSNGQPFAALCAERDAGLPFDRGDIEKLECLAALAVPALRWMDRASQPWYRRALQDAARSAARWRGTRHRHARRTVAGLALALLAAAAVPMDRAVSGKARVEGAEQRVIAAPVDGFVKSAPVRPGDHVKAGDALVDLVEGDLRLEHERWSSQLAQHENAYAGAMARSDAGQAAISLARAEEAQSQLALVDEQLNRGHLVAPFDALVVQGDLSQSIGAPVHQGDTLLTLATLDRFRVIVDVDEVDIGDVQAGQKGQLRLSSLPWDRKEVVVERVAPIAKTVDGRNVFEVQARLAAHDAELRPGLLGHAELVVGRAPPLWAWARHGIQRMRVVWWSWWG